MADDERIKGIVEALKELENDTTVPRNVKNNIHNTIKALSEDVDLSIRINKALNELDEVSDDSNMQTYTRTQIWNIVSMLEKINY